MTRLHRLGWQLKPEYAHYNKTLFIGNYWYNGDRRMFHEHSYLAELMSIETPEETNAYEQIDAASCLADIPHMTFVHPLALDNK